MKKFKDVVVDKMIKLRKHDLMPAYLLLDINTYSTLKDEGDSTFTGQTYLGLIVCVSETRAILIEVMPARIK